MIPFQPSRPDGRSDRQVILDLTQDAEPETLFPYAQLIAALEDGLDVEVTQDRVTGAARAANHTLLRERKRYLRAVRNTGLRVIRADEHLAVALDKKASAAMKIRQGINILRHVREDELDPVQRQLARGQLMILDGVYSAVQETQRRQARQEKVIADLSRRVERLEDVAD